MSIAATFLLGFGLLLAGISGLGEVLKQIGSRPFRRLATRYMHPRWKAFSLGLAAGVVLQSFTAAMVILAGLLRNGGVTLTQATAVLSGMCVSGNLLTFLVSIDLRVGVHLMTALGAVALYFRRSERFTHLWSTLFTLGLILYGLEVMVDAVRPLRNAPWFEQALVTAGHAPVWTLCIGVALGFLTQSSLAVTVVAVGMVRSGILPLADAQLAALSSLFGSVAFKSLLGTSIQGAGRRMFVLTNLAHVAGTAVFVTLQLVEMQTKAPLVMALMAHTGTPPSVQLAQAYTAASILIAVILYLMNPSITDRLRYLFTATDGDDPSRPAYLTSAMNEAPELLLEMAHLEQMRLMQLTAGLLNYPNDKQAKPPIRTRIQALRELHHAISDALADAGTHLTDREAIVRQTLLLERQVTLGELITSLSDLDMALSRSICVEPLQPLAVNCYEGCMFLMSQALEHLRGERLDPELYTRFFSDRNPQMQTLRQVYLDRFDNATDARELLVDLTMAYTKLVWQLGLLVSAESPRSSDTPPCSQDR